MSDLEGLYRELIMDHSRDPYGKGDPSALAHTHHELNPSCGDEITLGTKAKEMALILEAQNLAEREIPDYVAPDGNAKITFVRVPTLDEVPYPVKMEPNLVVEFYSR